MTTEAEKLYEQAQALRQKATPGPWEIRFAKKAPTDYEMNDCAIIADGGGPENIIAETFWRTGKDSYRPSEQNAALIVAAVNLLDALPALRAEWEREARLYEAKWWRGRADGIHKHDCVCVICERIAAFQQPAAQEKERGT